MSYEQALRTAIANELCHRQKPDTVTGDMPMPIHPNDIADIKVHWDNGDRWDPTDGGGMTTPTLEIEVTTMQPRPLGVSTEYHTMTFEMVFTALLRAVLGTEL